mgnify:FL=1
MFCFVFRNRCPKEGSSPRPDNLALTAIENTATIKDTRASSVSQPIPVPSQIHNFEKMQESRERIKSLGGISAGSPSGSPFDGQFFSFSSSTNPLHIRFCSLDRRASLDRLRQASIASSNSDLANSISPPAVRFNVEAAAAAVNPFSLVPSTRRTRNSKYKHLPMFNFVFSSSSHNSSNNTAAIANNSTVDIEFKSCSTTEFKIDYRCITIKITTNTN